MFQPRSMYTSVFLLLVITGAAAARAEVASTSNRPDLAAISVEIDHDGLIKAVLRNRGIAISTPFKADVYLDVNIRRTLNFGGDATRSGSIPGGITPSQGVVRRGRCGQGIE